MNKDKEFLKQAISLAMENKKKGGRPFGAIIVKDGEVISSGINEMLKTNDPSSHAEMEAIRAASKKLGSLSLEGCTVYASGHPCPMCLGAILMTNVKDVYFAFDNNDGAPFGYSTEVTYKKLGINLNTLPIPFEKLEMGMAASELYSLVQT